MSRTSPDEAPAGDELDPGSGVERRDDGSEARHRPGERVGDKYVLESLLGEGSMGTVWLARNEALDTEVAIKFVHVEAHAKDLRERLEREARAAAKLEHPSVVRVFDLGHTRSGEPFIVMERLVGRTLRAVVDKRDRIAPEKAVPLLLPIVSALAAAHARGIVHRDLKPENVLLVEAQGGSVVPKVVDFGVAHVAVPGAQSRRLTRLGTILGSPDYMAPEQAAGDVERIGPPADVWSLAVMLYEMVAGTKPFDGDSFLEQLGAIMQGEHPSLASIGAADAELSEIVEHALAKDADDRYPDARSFGIDLAAWALARGIEADVSGTSTSMHWGHSDHPTLSDFPRAPSSNSSSILARVSSGARRSGGATPSRGLSAGGSDLSERSLGESVDANAQGRAPRTGRGSHAEMDGRESVVPVSTKLVAFVAVLATLAGVLIALALARR